MAPICGSDCACSSFVPLYSLTPCCRVLIAGVALLSTLLALVVFVYNWHTMMVEYLMAACREEILLHLTAIRQSIITIHLAFTLLYIYLYLSISISLYTFLYLLLFLSIFIFFYLDLSSILLAQPPLDIFLISSCTSSIFFLLFLSLTTSLFYYLFLFPFFLHSRSAALAYLSLALALQYIFYITYRIEISLFSSAFCSTIAVTQHLSLR